MSFLSAANIVFLGTAVLTALAVFPFYRWANRIGLVHRAAPFSVPAKKPVPVGGGLVIFVILTAVIAGLILCRNTFDFKIILTPKLLVPLLIVLPFTVFIGLVNDRYGMNGKIKLFLQIFIASVVVGFAKRYSNITLFDTDIELHQLFYPLAVLWLVGMMNAIRLLDGIDGVAVTVSFFTSAAAAAIAYINQHYEIALVSTGLAGCLFGFFLHNRPPSKIYLGNTGCMIIGLFLGLLTFRAGIVADRDLSVCSPIAVMLIPLLDTFFAVIRRFNLSRSLFTPDHGHIHHILSARCSNGYTVLLLMSLLVLPCCAAGVLSTYYRNDWFAAAVAGQMIIVTFAADWLGHHELNIIYGRLKGRIRKTFDVKKYMTKNGEFYQIQGSGPWRAVWNQMVLAMRNRPCRKLRLNINIPGLNEDFFAEWENMDFQRKDRTAFSCTVVLLVDRKEVGKIKFVFETDDRNAAAADIERISAVCEACVRRYLETGSVNAEKFFLPETLKNSSVKTLNSYPYVFFHRNTAAD
ncbi:MAG: undecaprenyl/decaprenyl-phosphate alpha-N-acetylglucosaminyl 1-phosphate transferase [Planctomycetaceae bacterium]|jgi:UDP-GlcNAc:undecaprenyl-phosphate GlcNAc-1-phosphate transferase|nr:undecaprenyl/decaprenyl-phosphate alpha-N-acetylglucosaminyl 1-phosphate transferase [Planctomycetaceae bacterium]